MFVSRFVIRSMQISYANQSSDEPLAQIASPAMGRSASMGIAEENTSSGNQTPVAWMMITRSTSKLKARTTNKKVPDVALS